MTEHTKEEITKALECCQVNTAKGCEKCPYYDKTDDNLDCITKLCADALDLIKRYKAENEELTTLCDVQDKNMLEQMAEIERLQKKAIMVEAIENSINPLPFETDYDKAIKEAKSEAIKEFADKVIGLIYEADDINTVSEWQILNLVKEMTEGGDG